MYSAHVRDEDGAEQTADEAMQAEYQRQRAFLERSVSVLQAKLDQDGDRHKTDNLRVMQENVALIREINRLRSELKASEGRQKGGSGSGSGWADATALTSVRVDELTRLIAVQKHEMAQLRARIAELEIVRGTATLASDDPPSSRARQRQQLPPVSM